MESDREGRGDAPLPDQQASGGEKSAGDSAEQSELLHEEARAGQNEPSPTRARDEQPAEEAEEPWPFAWMAPFLENLTLLPNVGTAAKAAGIGRTRVYQLKASDERFAAAWTEALENGLDRIEAAALRAAIVGEERVYRTFRKDGSLASERIESLTSYQDRKMMLQAYRPEKFRERYEVKQSNDSEVDQQIRQLAEQLGIRADAAQAKKERAEEPAEAPAT